MPLGLAVQLFKVLLARVVSEIPFLPPSAYLWPFQPRQLLWLINLQRHYSSTINACSDTSNLVYHMHASPSVTYYRIVVYATDGQVCTGKIRDDSLRHQ